jgi:hypothetical protein
MPKNRLWVGCGVECRREVFRNADTPTTASHGDRYFAVIGPFTTRRGADFMANAGVGNPHCQCVADAERLAKKYTPDGWAKTAIIRD